MVGGISCGRSRKLLPPAALSRACSKQLCAGGEIYGGFLMLRAVLSTTVVILAAGALHTAQATILYDLQGHGHGSSATGCSYSDQITNLPGSPLEDSRQCPFGSAISFASCGVLGAEAGEMDGSGGFAGASFYDTTHDHRRNRTWPPDYGFRGIRRFSSSMHKYSPGDLRRIRLSKSSACGPAQRGMKRCLDMAANAQRAIFIGN